MNFARIAIGAAVLMAVSVPCTHAAPTLAARDVNMRQGPGTNFPIIAHIPGGSTVEVGNCEGRWCAVTYQGQSGFVIASAFDQGAPPPAGAKAPPPPPPPGYPPPPPGYPPPAGYYYPPGYAPYYYPRPYYYGPYYRPYWYRRWW